jgi:cysteine desulfurase / selenocysteine lyase
MQKSIKSQQSDNKAQQKKPEAEKQQSAKQAAGKQASNTTKKPKDEKQAQSATSGKQATKQEALPHQPFMNTEPAKAPTEKSLKTRFQSTIAIVLATDTSTTPLVVSYEDPEKKPVKCVKLDKNGTLIPTPRALQTFEGKEAISYAIELALQCCVKQVFILVDGPQDYQKKLRSLVSKINSRAKTDVQVITYDKEKAQRARTFSNNFEIIGIRAYEMRIAKSYLEKLECQDVLFLSCDQVRLKTHHIASLHDELHASKDLEFISSWITWLPRTPVIINKTFLDKLWEGNRIKLLKETHSRPYPFLNTKEFVFGEERLDANPTVPDKFSEFIGKHKMSALEAVRFAKAHKERSKETKALIKELNDADKVLIQKAYDIQKMMKGALSKAQAKELTAVDKWAQRNKLDFPIFQDKKQKNSLVYLDNAATSMRLGAAINVQRNFEEHENANVYRGSYELSAKATLSLNDARKALEAHLNSERRQVIFTKNTSDSCSIVARSWGEQNIHEGDYIALLPVEHHSNMLPWTMLAKRKGAHIIWLSINPDGTVDEADYKQALSKRPKLVCMAYIGNVFGITYPIAHLSELAKAAGARFFVDAAQAFPHKAINVEKLGADFVAFSAHKAYGPMGIGGLWVSKDAFAEMNPFEAGGGTISHVSLEDYYLRVGAIQYELGTPDVGQALGFAKAVEYMDTLGFDAIENHSTVLTRYLMSGLTNFDQLSIWGNHTSPEGETGLVSFSVYGTAPASVGSAFGALGVCVRSGGHCALPLHSAMGIRGTTRISIGIYNTSEDVDALLVALSTYLDYYLE